MMTDLPFYVYATLLVALLFTLIMFYYASNKNNTFSIGIISWAALHSILAIVGFYENTMTMPPRMMLTLFPLVVLILASLFSKKLKNWYATLDLKKLTYLHTVRIAAEMVLFWLFLAKYLPELMTFEGRNFDILIGITAPIVAYLGFKGNKINRSLLLGWNVLSFLFLLNIFVHVILSSPTVLQQMAYDQPSIAFMKFPFILIPTILVPLVLISNLAALVVLTKKKKEEGDS